MKRYSFLFALLITMLAGAAVLLATDTYRAQPALLSYDGFVPLDDGTLIQSAGDERIYYIEHGRKRWIDSLGTFQAQGFVFGQVRRLAAAEVARYPDGAPVTLRSRIVLPGEERVLPDLAPLAPYDLRFATLNGRTVLRFTGSFWNKGQQAFDVRTQSQGGNAADTEDVYQHIVSGDGTARTKYVGTFVFHPTHNHHHYDDFALYVLEPVRVPGHDMGAIAPSTRQKTTFCFRDDERNAHGIPAAPVQSVFTSCGSERQGLSAGWIDIYRSTLPDQYVDIQGLPSGIYALSFLVDPQRRFLEKDAGNNIATTFIELNASARTVRVIAEFSPFPTDTYRFDDRTLVRTSGNGSVYLLENGTKRWIRSVDIFTSYGFEWGRVLPVTEAMVAAIPDQPLIRQQGTSEVYLLNEHGYRRHIRSPELLASYGYTLADIVDASVFDVRSYPEGTLILRAGDTQVYLTEGNTRRGVGSLSDLERSGYDLRGLHVVSDADFSAYRAAP